MPFTESDLQAMPEAEIQKEIRIADNLFRQPAGTVDLLGMSKTLEADRFRIYIQLSRESRRRKRQSA
jgi:hypothetical protein